MVPLQFYDRFRSLLPDPASHETIVPGTTKLAFLSLMTELPTLQRQILLYLTDLLAVFASHSDINDMIAPKLAAIFQPGILSHPQHELLPRERQLSQKVLVFLINNEYPE